VQAENGKEWWKMEIWKSKKAAKKAQKPILMTATSAFDENENENLFNALHNKVLES